MALARLLQVSADEALQIAVSLHHAALVRPHRKHVEATVPVGLRRVVT